MAARAFEILTNATIRPFKVPSGKAVTQGLAVKHSGADDQIEDHAAVGDDAIGIALDAGSAGAVGVRVALFGNGVVKAKVGSAGASRGAFAKYSATGLTGATVGGGTTKLVVCGQFLQTGVQNDFVGLNLGMAAPTVGS